MRARSRHPALNSGTLPLFTALWLLWTSAAPAQTVYRCGPAGNTYSQVPCPDGRAIDVGDTRSPAQAAEARHALGAQERWAKQARRDRERDERAHPPALAGGIGPSKPSADRGERAEAPAKKGKGQRGNTAPAKQKDFVAFVPGSGKKQK